MARFDDHSGPATIRDVLSNCNNSTLTRLARAFVGKRPPTRKDQLLTSLLEVIEGDRLQELFTSLAPLLQAAIAETAWSKDGVFQPELFRAKYGQLPANYGIPEYESYSSFQPFQPKPEPSILDLLQPNGVMPPDLRKRFRLFVRKPAKATVKTTDALPSHIDFSDYKVPLEQRDMQHAAMHDLVSVLQLAAGGKLTLSPKSRWPTTAAIRAVEEVLDGGDFYAASGTAASSSGTDEDDDVEDYQLPGPIRGFAWPMLLQASEFTRVSGGKLTLTRLGQAALSHPPHLALRTIWDQWLVSDLLDEFRRVSAIRGQTGKGARFMTDPIERREAVVEALAECPAGRWISVGDFSTHMRAAGHRFEVTAHPHWLYLLDRQYGFLSDNWAVLQYRYILCVLMEYAATLGLLDVAFIPPAEADRDYGDLWGTDDLAFLSRYDGLEYFRINELGAWCLGISDDYHPLPPEVRRVLEIHPPQQLIITGPLSPADRMTLDTFSRPVGPVEWELDPLKILHAAAAGRQISELHLFLESASGEAIPGLTASFLSDVEQRLGMIHDAGGARLFHCESSDFAHALASDPISRKTCYRVDEHLLAVPARSEAAFRKALEKFGYVIPPGPPRDLGEMTDE